MIILLLETVYSQVVAFSLASQDSLVAHTTLLTATFTKLDLITIPAGSTLKVSFSSRQSDGSRNCLTTAGGWVGVSLICSFASNLLTVNGGFPRDFSVQDQLVFTIDNILNPSSVTGFTGTLSIVSGTTPIYNSLSANIPLSPGSLTCKTDATNSFASASSSYLFTVTNQVLLDANSYLKINFPGKWTYDPVSSQVLSSQIHCAAVQNLGSIFCTNVNVGNTRYVQVRSLFSSTYKGLFSLTLGTFTNPPSTYTGDSFQLVTYNQAGQVVEQCYTTLSKIDPAVLTSFSVSSGIVQKSIQSTVSFTSLTTMSGQDQLHLLIPSQFSLTAIGTITTSTGRVLPFQINGNKVIITQSISQSNSFVQPAPLTIQLILLNLVYPDSNRPTDLFNLKLVRNSFTVSQVSSLPFKANTNLLTKFQFTAISREISQSTQYQIVVTTNSRLSASSTLVVTFPAEVTASTFSQNCPFSTLGTITCSFNAPQLIVSIGAISPSTTFTIRAGPFKNPSYSQSFSFSAKTLDGGSADALVDQATSQITYTPGILTSADVSITTASFVCFTVNQYSFSINNKNPISAGGFIVITIPSDVGVPDPTAVSCSYGSIFPPCSYSSGTIKIQGLANSEILVGRLAQSPLKITLRNPVSTKPTATFKVQTYNGQGLALDKLTSGLTVTMSSGSKFNLLQATPSSFLNSQSASVQIKLSLFQITPGPIKLQIRWTNLIPTSIGLSASVSGSCSNSGFFTCTITDVSSNWQNFIVTVSVANQPSFKPTSHLLKVLTSDALYTMYQQSFTLTNNEAGSVTVASAFAPRQLATPCTLSLSLSPVSVLRSSQSVLLIFPSEYDLSTLSCLNSVGFVVVCNVAQRQLTVTSTTTYPSTIQFDINLKCPTKIGSFITVETFTSDGNLKQGSYTAISFTTSCTLPCKTCQSDLVTCIQCYSDSSLVSGQIYSSGGNCISACASTQFADSSNSCLPCSALCKTCVTTANTCTSCQTSLPILYNSQCQVSCPQGFYRLNDGCQVCVGSSNCLTCSSATVCITCQPSFFLSDSTKCVTACLAGYGPNSQRACVRCPNNCLTCSTSTICLTCSSGFLFDNGNCLTSCITPQTFAYNGECVSCKVPCMTCSTSVQTCASCDTTSANPYFLNNQCLNSCPTGMYSSGFQCAVCQPPCKTCSTLLDCKTCTTGSLYLTSCLNQCPSGYYSKNSICTPCVSPCVTCSDEFNCNSCIAGRVLQVTSCLTACTASYYVKIGQECKACQTPCLTCSGSTSSCVLCVSGKSFHQGSCLDFCPDTLYSLSNQCTACQSPCYLCISNVACKSCVSAVFLLNERCVPNCPSPLIGYKGSCVGCGQGCVSCESSPQQCTSCSSAYLYNDMLKQCSLSCSQGYYRKDNTCLSCNVKCSKCVSAVICTSCVAGYFLVGQLCSTDCPPQSYRLNGVCISCFQPCFNCSNDKTCTSCLAPLLLNMGTCSQNCAKETPFKVEGECKSCNVRKCQKCSLQICQFCQENYILSQGSCVTSCPVASSNISSQCVSNSLIQGSKFYPIPFLTCLLIFAVVLVGSKWLRVQTEFGQGMVGTGCLLTIVCAWAVLAMSLGMQLLLNSAIFGAALAINYVSCLVHFYKYRAVLRPWNLGSLSQAFIQLTVSHSFIRTFRSRILGWQILNREKSSPAYWLWLANLVYFLLMIGALKILVQSFLTSQYFMMGLQLFLLGLWLIPWQIKVISDNKSLDQQLRVIDWNQHETNLDHRVLTQPKQKESLEQRAFKRRNSEPEQPQSDAFPQVPNMMISKAIQDGIFRLPQNGFNDLFTIQEEEEQLPIIKEYNLPSLQQLRQRREQIRRSKEDQQFFASIQFIKEPDKLFQPTEDDQYMRFDDKSLTQRSNNFQSFRFRKNSAKPAELTRRQYSVDQPSLLNIRDVQYSDLDEPQPKIQLKRRKELQEQESGDRRPGEYLDLKEKSSTKQLKSLGKTSLASKFKLPKIKK